ncbi:MAG TPA: hypothetical protein VNO52_05640 [Methylomirabilota bacterium]|nr:hypothetical protein [Methylomirabilota bacterium]
MLTQICTLKFRDGQMVHGLIEAESANGEYPIHYAGAVDRLPRRFETGDPADLRGLFRNLARELDAEFSEQTTGEYDRWAE